jgi:hypothetical protein
MAFFSRCDDVDLLRELLRSLRPRAAAAVRQHEMRGSRVPDPDDIEAAATPATESEARRILLATDDFAQLQALSRSIGRRVEELQGM